MIFAIFMAVSRFLGMHDKPQRPDWFPQLTQSAPRGMLPRLAHRAAVGSARMIVLTLWDMRPIRLATNDLGARGAGPRCHSRHWRHRGAAADPGPLIRRVLLDIRAVKSSILERNSLRIGEVFALL
jgi:hypothetical protein